MPAAILGGAIVLGGLIGAAPVWETPVSATGYNEAISGCSATDGDTIRCGGERIRLLAIDAPEMPGHCREGRVCAPGDPYASTSNLKSAMSGNLTIDRVGQDRYGRTLARVAGKKGDLSCWQLQHGHAIYKSSWDNGQLIAQTCPTAIP